MITPSAIFWTLIGGIVPAVVWLMFWLREDRKHPEPRSVILLTFIAGMVAVPLAIPLEKIFYRPDFLVSTFIAWATIEELLKFGAAYFVAVRSREMDEPIDALIYLMTAALGFVAAENALFLLDPITDGDLTNSLITGNLRFVGASLLHTLASAVIGLAIALTFYKPAFSRRFAILLGVLAAIALHTAFNVFIMNESNAFTVAAFGFVWLLVIALMLAFEKVKRIYPVDRA